MRLLELGVYTFHRKPWTYFDDFACSHGDLLHQRSRTKVLWEEVVQTSNRSTPNSLHREGGEGGEGGERK